MTGSGLRVAHVGLRRRCREICVCDTGSQPGAMGGESLLLANAPRIAEDLQVEGDQFCLARPRAGQSQRQTLASGCQSGSSSRRREPSHRPCPQPGPPGSLGLSLPCTPPGHPERLFFPFGWQKPHRCPGLSSVCRSQMRLPKASFLLLEKVLFQLSPVGVRQSLQEADIRPDPRPSTLPPD